MKIKALAISTIVAGAMVLASAAPSNAWWYAYTPNYQYPYYGYGYGYPYGGYYDSGAAIAGFALGIGALAAAAAAQQAAQAQPACWQQFDRRGRFRGWLCR